LALEMIHMMWVTISYIKLKDDYQVGLSDAMGFVFCLDYVFGYATIHLVDMMFINQSFNSSLIKLLVTIDRTTHEISHEINNDQSQSSQTESNSIKSFQLTSLSWLILIAKLEIVKYITKVFMLHWLVLAN